MNTQKGIAPLIIALIVAVVLGGGYAVVKTNPGLAKKLGMEKQVEKKVTNTSEISAQGIVVDNNMENLDIGAYLQIKGSDGEGDIFVVYKPFVDRKESVCLNKVDAFAIGVGTLVEVKGIKIEERDGVKPKSLMISTCESLEYYIRDISDETANWKTYKNEKYGFEFKYPKDWTVNDTSKGADYATFQYSVFPRCGSDRECFGELIQIALRKKSFNEYIWDPYFSKKSAYTLDGKAGFVIINSLSGSGGSIYVFEKDGKAFTIDVGSTNDFATGTEEKNLNKEVNQILSSFKFTEKHIPTAPTSEQQSVIDYLQANITSIIKAKPILGSTKWHFYNIVFYPSNKILVSFEDGHITGGFLGSYTINGSRVSVKYTEEVINTGDEAKRLSEKYNLVSEESVKYKKTPNSGFELTE